MTSRGEGTRFVFYRSSCLRSSSFLTLGYVGILSSFMSILRTSTSREPVFLVSTEALWFCTLIFFFLAETGILTTEKEVYEGKLEMRRNRHHQKTSLSKKQRKKRRKNCITVWEDLSHTFLFFLKSKRKVNMTIHCISCLLSKNSFSLLFFLDVHVSKHHKSCL